MFLDNVEQVLRMAQRGNLELESAWDKIIDPNHKSGRLSRPDKFVWTEVQCLLSEKLALLEEMLAFMGRFEYVSSGDSMGYCPVVGCVGAAEEGHTTPEREHAPDCRDTARRTELSQQIAELKKELGI